ncbi:MAG: peptide chain release factor N(5)-glutamine methyltransferase [Clostridia bacterium]|nr:peptide chain release factor N(5)-glutamine methyltransferase [Clostridia bacterium]
MKFKELCHKLSAYGVQSPETEARIIIEKLFNVGYAAQLANPSKDFSSPELDSLIEKRKEHIPLQYILGEWEFMGKEFFVSPSCLIPRADTEILVEKAIEILKKGGDVADLCTGSGCIGLSIMMYAHPTSMTLMDISENALEMARKNAQRHGLLNSCQLVLGDIRCDMPNKRYDLIVSNPPYIPTRDIDSLSDEVKKEPSLALDGGSDGLDIIKFLVGDGLSYLKENGQMLIEFGYDQKEQMDALLTEKINTGSIKSYQILYDYGGNPRVAQISK